MTEIAEWTNTRVTFHAMRIVEEKISRIAALLGLPKLE
jgi:hypothetical protein